jgi:hypothetical protein
VYFEAHITIEPVCDERLVSLAYVTHEHGFRVAKLLLEKTPSRKDSFCTGHATTYREIRKRLSSCVAALRVAGFAVWRAKIEVVVFDERYGDRR